MREHGFKKLAVWQRAKQLAVNVYKVTAEGKVSRDFGLVELGKMLGGLIKARRRLIPRLLLVVTGFVLGMLLSGMV